MNQSETPAIGTFRLRFLLALSLLAALSVNNYLLWGWGIDALSARAGALDAGARQQDLLARSSSLATRLVSETSEERQRELRGTLQTTLRQLEDLHDSLISGSEALNLPKLETPALRELYFSEAKDLDNKLRKFLADARSLVTAPADQLSRDNAGYQQMIAAEGPLLGFLAEAEDLYQRQVDRQVARLQTLRSWALGSMLVGILLTAVLVFRPMAQRIEQEVENLTSLNTTLEKRVAERTAAAEERASQLARSEAALREQTHVLRSILESMPEGVIVANEQGQFLLFNPAAERILGIGPGAAPPDQWPTYFGLYLPDRVTPYPPEDLPLRRAMRGESVDRAEVFVRPGKGPAGIWLSSTSRPLYDEAGNIRGGVVVFQDITRRKRAEEALRDSEALYQSLVESLPLNFFRKDLDGAVTFANKRYCDTLNRPLDDLLGKTDFDLFPVELAEKYLRDDHRVIDTGEPFECIEQHRKPNGEMIYVQVFKAPVYDSEGKCVGVQGIFWDVTDRQTAELRLRRTALELARSNEELQRFALVASQDLQDPLHGLQESTHSLVARCLHTLDQQAQQDLRHIQATADRMQRLLDDLLSLARVSTQGPVFETVDLNQVAREVVASLRSRIEESGGQVEIGDLPSIEADPDQVRQLLENLVDNALKFRRPETPPSVRIQGRICRQPSRDERSHEAESLCQIEVEDNGVGFDEQHLDRVFELFHRTSTENGTGLGLALCRKIAQRHGGTISARSIPGTGSTFIVTMAVKQARETAEMT